VMSVCRRVVGRSPDVDDAFQATFFALSQRPASIYECLSLSGWLYSVAWRASVKLVRLRKRTMTQPLPDQVPATEPDPLDAIAQANDLATLDEELNRLPQKFRDVLVMSYFAQQTNQEIADQLNESKGAIDGRIRDARRMLRVRLARRGVEVGVLAVATAYVQSSASAASPALIQKTISLGAPGMVSQEFAATNAAEVAHMKLLTSTGIPLMSKIGLTIASGLVLATGLWGMTHLAAFQDADGDSDVKGVDADAGDAAINDEPLVELSGRTETSDSTVNDVDSAAVEYGVILRDGSGMGFKGEARTAKARDQLNRTTSEFSRLSASEVEQRLNELVHHEKVKNLSFPGENPLTDILEQISTHISTSQDTRFAIVPDDRRLEEQSVSLNDVMIKDIELDGISLSSALDIIMGQTNPALTWLARDEVIQITTAEEADRYMFLRSYDIVKLRNLRMASTTPWELGITETIEKLTSPTCNWASPDFDGGQMRVIGNRLLVRNNRDAHEHVVAVLEQLEMAVEETWSKSSKD